VTAFQIAADDHVFFENDKYLAKKMIDLMCQGTMPVYQERSFFSLLCSF
jgi:hypothetical protein